MSLENITKTSPRNRKELIKMSENKLIAAFFQAQEEGIKQVDTLRLHLISGIPQPEIDTPQAWGVKSWNQLQSKEGIFRKGKGKTVKFFYESVESLLKSYPARTQDVEATSENNGTHESVKVFAIPTQEGLSEDSTTTTELIEKAESLLSELEETNDFIPVQVLPQQMAIGGEDDEIPEDDADNFVSGETAAIKPHWREIFGELELVNPLFARLAGIASCYYHPSFDFPEYYCLVSKVREIFDNLDSDRTKVSKLSKELAQWKPSSKFGLLLMGILSFNCPRYLLKNPNAGFNAGGYTFTDGERPAKMPMFVATGKTGSGKSEIIKLLSMISDGTYSVSTTSASVAMKISETKDRRKGGDEYSLGWRRLPLEHYDLRTSEHSNPICLIPDLSRRGSDFPRLEEALKSACEQDKNIERQSGSLDSSNKTWLLNGANIAISSCYELSDDPNHPISELIRRSVVFGCYGLNDENGEKVKGLLLSPDDLDWSDFSLSYLWKKEYSRLASGNQVNKLVAVKDGKSKQMIYPIMNAEKEVRTWESEYKIKSGSLDFIASLLGFGLVCYVRRNKLISREFLVESLKHYLENTKVVLNNQNTSTEFTEQFTEILNAAILKLSASNNEPEYANKIGISATLIQKHYQNTAKRLLASKKDIPSLTELMSSLGYEARIKDAKGNFYEDINGEVETRYFLSEDANLKL